MKVRAIYKTLKLVLLIFSAAACPIFASQPASARKPEPMPEKLPQEAIDALSGGGGWQPGETPRTFIRKRRNLSDSYLKLSCDDSIAVDRASYAKLASLVEGEPRGLTSAELQELNSLIPEGNPQLTAEGAGGQSRYLAGREMVLLWTITKTIGPCQSIGENASRRPLLNQMDLWVYLPLAAQAETNCQRLHFYVESQGNPMNEIGALERFIEAAAISNDSEVAFDMREGRVIFQAQAAGKAAGVASSAVSATSATSVASATSVTSLTASILRRIGTKPIPFFHIEIPGAYNPRLLTGANWRRDGKPVVVLLVNFGKAAQSAYVYCFTSAKVEAIQEIQAVSMEIAQDLSQKGIQTMEAIEGSTVTHDRFYIFSNSTGRLSELLSARKRLAENVLRQMRWENEIASYSSENKLGVASLLLDAEEEAKAEAILRELTDKKDKTIDRKVVSAALKLLKSLRTSSLRDTRTQY